MELTGTNWNPSLFLTTSRLQVAAGQQEKPEPFAMDMCAHLAQDLGKLKKEIWLLLELLQVQELHHVKKTNQLTGDNMQELPQYLTPCTDLQKVKGLFIHSCLPNPVFLYG